MDCVRMRVRFELIVIYMQYCTGIHLCFVYFIRLYSKHCILLHQYLLLSCTIYIHKNWWFSTCGLQFFFFSICITNLCQQEINPPSEMIESKKYTNVVLGKHNQNPNAGQPKAISFGLEKVEQTISRFLQPATN